MILTLTNGNAGISYWKAGRFVLSVGSAIVGSTGKVRIWCSSIGSKTSPIATYTQTSATNLKIDISDLVRAYSPAYVYWCTESADGTTLGTTRTITITYAGLINPNGVYVPANPLTSKGALIIPPRMYYEGISQSEVEAEFFQNTADSWAVTGDATMSQDGRNIGQIHGAFALCGEYAQQCLIYKPRAMRCDAEYALVRWVSFSGVSRTHIFEAIKHKQSTNDAFSLLPIDNEYIEIKGREDGFVLHLDNLDAYDLWYYADVLQSSKVEVSFDGNTYNRAQITNKSIVLPDGNAGTDGKLDINVNWKRYDSVAL